MNPTETNPVLLFSSDLDGTLIGKPDATSAFRKSWEVLPGKDRPMLCYNTGRLLNQTLELLKTSDLPDPDYLICGVGSLIYDMSSNSTIKAFNETLATGWDLKRVEQVLSNHATISKQPPENQHPFKSSWHCHNALPDDIEALEKELAAAGLEVNVVYSSSRDLDILPKYANKGNSLSWLLTRLKIPPHQVLVAGDTGNDISMFELKGVRGIIVENTQPELLQGTVHLETYVALQPFADGVLEGLKHFGVIQRIMEPGATDIHKRHYEQSLRHVLKTEQTKTLSEEQFNLIDVAYQKAIEAVMKNITPMGFSACSIMDNAFANTDQNYQSVWARDGAMTVLRTISVGIEEIQECQLNTLLTLLKNVSTYGAVPSSVSIVDERPDYSGVGDIASIDSGLWLIIAFHRYVRETRNFDLLREWFPVLEKVISRLRAIDSNNDSLLEIPEAGDWTDLFGRSYNVLIDEVLWYYANFCFARLAELVGDIEQASECLYWTQTIKEAIITKFWPSISSEHGMRSFADQQYSLGDTSYLLAEITPFSFDWRCDVYGNIMACMFNVLDVERAQKAFRFMWGVGVNKPWPVVNLYPPVNAGDPKWRPYYTVNLLNLPHHYHNGGIWPFIGAEWVRFISRLGLREIAHKELYRLALLNKQGIHHDWEFNEWYHGVTGRPMGKAFQSWSAAGFIGACSSLRIDAISADKAE